jgi:hypothetical protein
MNVITSRMCSITGWLPVPEAQRRAAHELVAEALRAGNIFSHEPTLGDKRGLVHSVDLDIRRRTGYDSRISNPDALRMEIAGPGDQLFAYTAVLGRRIGTPHLGTRGRGQGRVGRGDSQTQYLVQYAGTDAEGQSWPPKWEPSENIVGGDPAAELDIALFPGTLNSTRKLVGREVTVLDINSGLVEGAELHGS